MKISILGAGNAGCGVAADLSIKGHDVTLIKTSHSVHDENFEYLRKNNGEMTIDEFGDIKKSKINKISRSLEDIYDSKLVIFFIQTSYHLDLIKRVSKYISDDQMILFNPGYLSSAYLLDHCQKDIIISEAESSFIDGRIIRPGYFKVSFRNIRNPVGIYPKRRINEAKTMLDQLDERITYLDCILEASLNNPNLIVHTVGSIMSIPRIENSKGDFHMYHEVYKEDNKYTWNIVEKLDQEKKNILEKLNLKQISYLDACKYRNSINQDVNSKDVFINYAQSDDAVSGPSNVNSRFIYEDVPQGLVLLESLGEYLNVETPVTSSLIEISSAALGENLRTIGRTLEKLGKNNINKIINDALL